MTACKKPICCVVAAASSLNIPVVCPFMGVFKSADKSADYNYLASGTFYCAVLIYNSFVRILVDRMAKVKEVNGILFIISAPSGAGKTTLCRMAVDYFPHLRHSISYTTRVRRSGEANGVDYHFISKETFQEMIDRNEFLEWAEVHGNKYGTSMQDIQSLLEKGLDIILDIDVQGAKQVKKQLSVNNEPLAVFIFILPPSLEICEQRIRNRGKDNQEAILSRLENARNEIKELIWYDYLIINENLEEAFERLKSVIVAEKSKRERMIKEVKGLYSKVLGE